MFNNYYRDKKVLITGHTGFKGSWLALWLKDLGADIVGVSDEIPTSPSLYEAAGLEELVRGYQCDIRNSDKLREIIFQEKPDIVFHLAAQAIVSKSYEDPIDTIERNVLGSASLLNCLKDYNDPLKLIFITSDKCYENIEWEWGYRENDRLGGKDVYSASKACAEIIFNSFYHSFLKNKSNLLLCTTRAGNVIGGGDWAKDRIVADCARSWSESKPVKIRAPNATRPWQHVLEPLSGYLHLGALLNEDLNGKSYNFGPRAEQNNKVLELLRDLFCFWDLKDFEPYEIVDSIPFHEAGLLKLNCDRALFDLKWEPNLTYDECVEFVGTWYNNYYNLNDATDLRVFTLDQIRRYSNLAVSRSLKWTK